MHGLCQLALHGFSCSTCYAKRKLFILFYMFYFPMPNLNPTLSRNKKYQMTKKYQSFFALNNAC